MLEPIYKEFADKFNSEYVTGDTKVTVAKVDCDSERNYVKFHYVY
jgi:hypothetical protein